MSGLGAAGLPMPKLIDLCQGTTWTMLRRSYVNAVYRGVFRNQGERGGGDFPLLFTTRLNQYDCCYYYLHNFNKTFLQTCAIIIKFKFF